MFFQQNDSFFQSVMPKRDERLPKATEQEKERKEEEEKERKEEEERERKGGSERETERQSESVSEGGRDGQGGAYEILSKCMHLPPNLRNTNQNQ